MLLKKVVLLLIVFSLTAIACRIPAALVEKTPTPYDSGEIQPPQVVLLARQALADELSISPERITISKIETARWENTCLEIPAPGETCIPAEIEGYLVEMKTTNTEYTYHTDTQNLYRRVPQDQWGQAALQSQRLLAGLLGYNPDSIEIVSEQSTTFPDTCLGVQIAEIACAQIRTAGTIIILRAGENNYTFHSALDPIAPVLAEVAGFTTSIPALTWSRQGGIPVTCDDLMLYLSGWAVQYSCLGATGQEPGVIPLTPNQQRQLLQWLLTYRPFEFRETSQGGVSNKMIFFGIGRDDAEFEDQKEISEFCTQILKPPATPVPPGP